MNFALIQHHKWSLSDIENMIPFERLLYIDLLSSHMKAEQDKLKDEMLLAKSRSRR